MPAPPDPPIPPDSGTGGGSRVSERYVSIAPRSIPTVVVYLLLLGLLVLYRNAIADSWAFVLLALILLVYLARYLSTYYVLDAERLGARRLFGSRRIRYEEIRALQLTDLRDLGPVGLVGTWGWRGRVWSPIVGPMDTVHTVSRGLLISAGPVPLFISPRDPESFGRELSRRARSAGAVLPVDPAPLVPGASAALG